MESATEGKLAVQFGFEVRVVLQPGHDRQQGVDDGVTGDKNGGGVNPFALQVGAGRFGGRKVQVGNGAGDFAVDFFGERRVLVARAQARFNMTHRYAGVVRSQAGGQGCGGVAMHQHQIRLLCSQHPLEAGQNAAAQVVQILTGLHDVQVMLGRDVKQMENLVQHLAVLGRDADHGFAVRCSGLKAFDQGSHLDGLGAGAKDDEDFGRVRHATLCVASLTAIKQALPLG